MNGYVSNSNIGLSVVNLRRRGTRRVVAGKVLETGKERVRNSGTTREHGERKLKIHITIIHCCRKLGGIKSLNRKFIPNSCSHPPFSHFSQPPVPTPLLPPHVPTPCSHPMFPPLCYHPLLLPPSEEDLLQFDKIRPRGLDSRSMYKKNNRTYHKFDKVQPLC